MADVVIVGAGIIGATAAYKLAQDGADVVLIERLYTSGQQSIRNWGFVRQAGRNSAELPLMKAAVQRWSDLENELDTDLGWVQGGCLTVSNTAKQTRRFRSWVEMADRYDVDSRIVTSAEIDRIAPGLSVDTVNAALYCPDDGHADPVKTTAALLEAASRNGATVRTGESVLGFTRSSDRLTGVSTTEGHITADTVICSAGAGSRQLLRKVNIDIPQQYILSTAALTTPLPQFTQAAVWTPSVSFQQRPDGRCVFAGGGTGEIQIGLDTALMARYFLPGLVKNLPHLKLRIGRRLLQQLKTAVVGFRRTGVQEIANSVDPAPLPNTRQVRKSFTELQRILPLAKMSNVESTWSGIIDTTPDATPIIDRAESPSGLVVATGFSGHGFGIGVPAGEAAASLALGCHLPFDMHPFRVGRFHDKSYGTAKALL